MLDHFKTYLTGAAAAAALLAPAAGWAQAADPVQTGNSTATAEQGLDEEADGDQKAWSVSATVLSRVYQGTFAGLANEDPSLDADAAKDSSHAFDRWLNLYVLDAGYTVGDFKLGAEVLWTHWLTPGGGYNEPYEIRFEDSSLSAAWSGYNIEAIDANVSANYTLTLPTSDVSRTANLIANNSLSAQLSKTFFGRLTLAYTLGGTWSPHTQQIATISKENAQVYREDEVIGSNDVARIGPYNTQFAMTNALGVNVVVWDKLSASVSYALTKAWTYNVDNDDEFAPELDHIQTGRMTSDLSTASVALTYPIGKYVSVSGGIRTVQQPKTADNKSFRFPWWSFSGPAGNRSAVQVSVSGSY